MTEQHDKTQIDISLLELEGILITLNQLCSKKRLRNLIKFLIEYREQLNRQAELK